jgi:hypothetical protein
MQQQKWSQRMAETQPLERGSVPNMLLSIVC